MKYGIIFLILFVFYILWFMVNFLFWDCGTCDRQKELLIFKKKENMYELKNGEDEYKVSHHKNDQFTKKEESQRALQQFTNTKNFTVN